MSPDTEHSLHVSAGNLPAESIHPRAVPSLDLLTHAGHWLADIHIVQGVISDIQEHLSYRNHPYLDASDCIVLPGFIDLHVHGAMGHDTMDGSVDGLRAMARFFASHGVTAFMPTTMTASHEQTLAAVHSVATLFVEQNAAKQISDKPTHHNGAKILGIHLEGPYISPDCPGAQKADAIRPPNLQEFIELVHAGPVRMVTLAPEQPGAADLIRAALAHGVTPVIGHSSATYADCEAAIQNGVHHATHTYNAMTGLHHRAPGTLGSILTNDTIYAQLIADTIHVHPAAMDILYRCKGIKRTLLITDAMRATGLPPGEYDLGGQTVSVDGERCVLPNGVLAGSILTMENALANFMAATSLSLHKAWPASSRIPAQSIQLGHEYGTLAVGGRGDLVLLDANLEVVATIVAGDVVYLRDPERLHNTAYTGMQG